MGRKRKDVEEKKVRVHISIKKRYYDEIKKRKINLSKFVEDALKVFLKR